VGTRKNLKEEGKRKKGGESRPESSLPSCAVYASGNKKEKKREGKGRKREGGKEGEKVGPSLPILSFPSQPFVKGGKTIKKREEKKRRKKERER